ncbi:MAG: aspartate-semialdehyde dehydrogenase, partial [Gemmatimonadetes bacterium]|nr:aspartate-semialdehyde dehydrogenase [Gemmatimonadota bacterium]
MSGNYNVAIMGATGAVGQVFLEILQQRNFPVGELRLLASSRSAGKTVDFRGDTLTIQELSKDSFEGIDLVLSSASGSLSREFVPAAVEAGAVVVDNTSAFRMDPQVPLVVPEVNSADLDDHQGIVANPNCSTIIMVVVLWPLYEQIRIRRVVVSTYQAISGAGAAAMAELEQQTRDVLAGKAATPKELPHPIAFNLFSHNSAIGPDGYCEEEEKMIRETRKMFHDDDLR